MALVLLGICGCSSSKPEAEKSTPEESAVVHLETEPTPLPGSFVQPSKPIDPWPVLVRTIESRGGKVSGDATGITAIDWQHAPINNLDLELLSEIPTLRRLYLAGTKIDSRGFAYLSQLPDLERLALWNTPITDDDLKFLANAKHLKVLDLSRTRIVGNGFAHLEHLPHLEILIFRGNTIAEAMPAHLSRIQQLKQLDLSQSSHVGNGLAHLAACPNLEILNLEHSDYQVDPNPLLAQIKTLKELNLRGRIFRGKDIAPLRELPLLEELMIDFCHADLLTELARFPNLRRLDLSRAYRRNVQEKFPELGKMRKLEIITYAYHGNQDEWVKHVSKCPALREIHIADRSPNRPQFTDEGLAHLQARPTLRVLDVRFATASLAGLQQLARANPKLRILVRPIQVHGLDDAFRTLKVGAKHSRDGGPRLILDRELDITGLRLDDARIFLPSLQLIGKAINPEKLQHLGLGYTNLGDAALLALPVGSALKQLNLRDTQITANGLKAWSGGNFPDWPQLEDLDLSGTQLDDDCLRWIATLKQLKTLRLVNVTGVSNQGWAALEKLPHLTTLEK